MAGAEFKITDAIDPGISQKLKEISSQLKKTTSDYSVFTQELAKKIDVNPGNLSELESKAKGYTSVLSKLHASQNKLADLQEQQLKIFGEISKKIDQIIMPLSRLSESMANFSSKVNSANEELDKSASSTQKAAQGMQNASKQASLASHDYDTIIKSIEAYDVQINKLYKAQLKNKESANSVKNDISDLSSAYRKRMIDIETYTNKMAELKKKQTELSEENKQYNNLLRTHARVIVSAQGSYDEMSAAVLQLERRYKSIEKTEREGEIGKDLLNNIKKLKDELKSIDASMGNYQRNVGNYMSAFEGMEDKIKDLLGLNSTFAQSIMSLGEGGGANFFNNLSAGAGAFSRTLSGLLSNPAFLAIAGIAGVGAVFKFWYDYNKGIQEATKLTQQFTGATGDELKRNRNEVQALADMYDKDFKETLIAVNSVSKQFGISFDEAFNYIRDGFISGADANGEFLDNLKEYPAYFREAGISASEFIAITTQANKQGIFSDKSVDVIKEGNIRIREMTKATSAALDGIGISSKRVMEELQNGSKTTFDIMKEVSGKLAEFPESSSAVGTALADIFGGPGEDAGLQYIKTLKDIDTNLDKVKENAGKLADLQDMQLQSQLELENTLSSLFDATGGSFEEMTTKAKIFANEGIVYIINKTVELINWFIDLYNRSAAFRVVIQGIGETFRVGFSIIEGVLSTLMSNLKTVAKMLKGLFTLDFDAIEQAWEDSAKKSVDAVSNVLSDGKKSWNKIISSTQKQIDPIKIPFEIEPSNNRVKEDVVVSGGSRKLTEKEQKELEKQRKEQLRIEKEYQNSKLELMNDGLEKELSKIRLNYTQRIAEVKGNSEKENETRKNLAEKMQQELADKEIEYYLNLEKKKVQLALDVVREGSKEEFDLRMRQIDLEEEAEINAMKGNYENLQAVRDKYEKKRVDEINRQTEDAIKRMEDSVGHEAEAFAIGLNEQAALLKERYAEGKISKKDYDREILRMETETSRAILDVQIAAAEKELDLAEKTGTLTKERVEQLRLQLASMKAEYSQLGADEALDKRENKIADYEDLKKSIDAIKGASDDLDNGFSGLLDGVSSFAKIAVDKISGVWDELSDEEKIQKVTEMWASMASGIGEMISSIYDQQIESVEAEQEANEKAGEEEIARIESLEEKGAITTEEAEARKRAAEDKTAKKNAELEKKKAALKTKQAKFEKATSIAEAAIQIAGGILQTIKSLGFPAAIPMIAALGAMGAIQLATIIATPIPKYAKGTSSHKGGLAIVGDGGISETVVTDKGSYITPSVPTLVDIPRGSKVIPYAVDMERMMAHASDFDGLMAYRDENNLPPISIVNDYSELEKKIGRLEKSQRLGFSKLARAIKDNNYQQFSKSI